MGEMVFCFITLSILYLVFALLMLSSNFTSIFFDLNYSCFVLQTIVVVAVVPHGVVQLGSLNKVR